MIRLNNLPSRAVRYARKRLDKRTKLHFIHIGKNAGTQVTFVGRQIHATSKRYQYRSYGHHMQLADLPEGDPYFFSVREPVARFKSGFYSRKRKGQPRTYSEWSPSEAIAFKHFEHANDLAEALFDDSERGLQAYQAMRSINHVAQPQHFNFGRMGHFLTLRPPAFILRQSHLAEDWATLARSINLDVDVQLTQNKRLSHKNDYSAVPPLSDMAVKNLKLWYAADLEFVKLCEAWIIEKNEIRSE